MECSATHYSWWLLIIIIIIFIIIVNVIMFTHKANWHFTVIVNCYHDCSSLLTMGNDHHLTSNIHYNEHHWYIYQGVCVHVMMMGGLIGGFWLRTSEAGRIFIRPSYNTIQIGLMGGVILKTKTKTIGRNAHGGHKGSLGEAREAVGGLAASVWGRWLGNDPPSHLTSHLMAVPIQVIQQRHK